MSYFIPVTIAAFVTLGYKARLYLKLKARKHAILGSFWTKLRIFYAITFPVLLFIQLCVSSHSLLFILGLFIPFVLIVIDVASFFLGGVYERGFVYASHIIFYHVIRECMFLDESTLNIVTHTRNKPIRIKIQREDHRELLERLLSDIRPVDTLST